MDSPAIAERNQKKPDVFPGLAVSTEFSLVSVPNLYVITPGATMRYQLLRKELPLSHTEPAYRVNWYILPDPQNIRALESSDSAIIKHAVDKLDLNICWWNYTWAEEECGRYFVACRIWSDHRASWAYLAHLLVAVNTPLARVWNEKRKEVPSHPDEALRMFDHETELIRGVHYSSLECNPETHMRFEDPALREVEVKQLDQRNYIWETGYLTQLSRRYDDLIHNNPKNPTIVPVRAELRTLLDSERQKNFDRIMAAREEYAVKLTELLAGTEGKVRYPVKAIHFSTADQQIEVLNVFVAKLDSKLWEPPVELRRSSPQWPEREKWCLVDWTFPTRTDMPKYCEVWGADDEDALNRLFRSWDRYANRYSPGLVWLELKIGTLTISHQFKTNGKTTADRFIDAVELVAQGAMIVSGLGWVFGPGIFAWSATLRMAESAISAMSTYGGIASGAIKTYLRHSLGIEDPGADLCDSITIMANLLAGVGMLAIATKDAKSIWSRAAPVIFRENADKIYKGTLYGQITLEGLDGIILADEIHDQYLSIVTDPDLPAYERVLRLNAWGREAAASGLLKVLAFVPYLQELKELHTPPVHVTKPNKFGYPNNVALTPREKLRLLRDPKTPNPVDLNQLVPTEGFVPPLPEKKSAPTDYVPGQGRVQGKQPIVERRTTIHRTRADQNIRIGRYRNVTYNAKAIQRSGMVAAHANSLSDIARRHNTFIFVNKTAPGAAKNIENGCIGKPRCVKPKNAEEGPALGYIPLDQRLAPKVANPSAELLKKYGPTADDVINAMNAEVKLLIREGKAIPVTVEIPGPPPSTIDVLGDPATGKPFTSDYDIAIIGRKGIPADLHKGELGFQEYLDAATVQEFGSRIGRYDLVAHGFTNNSDFDVGLTFELTVFEPWGSIVTIDKGPSSNPHQHLKEYANAMLELGYHFDPHPNWKWVMGIDGKWH